MNVVFASASPATSPRQQGGKRIVILSGWRVFPCNTGGHVRTGGIAHALARLGHDVLLYSLTGRQGDYGMNSFVGPRHQINQIAPNLVEETYLGLQLGITQHLARRFDFPRFWQHLLLRHGLIPARLRAALNSADIILCDTPWCPPVPGVWSTKPWFLISHNLEYRLLNQASSRQQRYAAWMQGVEAAATRIYRDIFVCSEEDGQFFRSHDPERRLRLPFIACGVDPKEYEVAAGTRERIRSQLALEENDHLLVFSASRHAPNVEAFTALRSFCRAEASFLARERVHILVLGSISDTAYREGALIVTGRVPEIAPYLAAADGGLNPITRGSGANVKLFEYLAAGLPVISTLFGVRGTALQPEIDFLPFEQARARETIERFIRERTAEQWRSRAAAVWARHSESCDIDELVKQAIAQRPEFQM